MFVGREKELTSLTEHYQTNKFQFAVIYGRRRIGKTALINKFLQDKKVIYFTAIEENANDNLQRFSKAIRHFINPQINDDSSFASFEQAFQEIGEVAKKERVVLVIDEYPYLAQAYPAVSSMLQSYIDHVYSETNMFLILCGSSMSFMKYQVLGYKSPLYGRRTVQYKLHPFTLKETQELLPNYSKIDAFEINSIMGGIPKYLSLVSDQVDVMTNVKNTFLNTDSILFEEPNNLLKQELRDPATYNSIINAIAAGASKLIKIATKVHLASGAISTYLQNLISLGIIAKKIPVTEQDKPNSKKTLYYIKDGMFRFWYTFISKNISLIEMGYSEPVIEQIKQQLSVFLGPSFEELSQEYLWDHMMDKKIVPEYFRRLVYWWGTDQRIKQKVEMDVVGISMDDSAGFLGECKWKNEPISRSILETLISRSNLFNYPKKYYYLFSKVGFTDSCKELAGQIKCHLITFEQI